MDARFRSRRFLLTDNEREFFHALRSVLHPRYGISCKVRLADVITCRKKDWETGGANRIAQKHVDFVIFRIDTARIVAAVELDDRSHDMPARRQRDQFINRLFRTAKVRFIRVPASWTYTAESVANCFRNAKLNVLQDSLPTGIFRD